MTRTCFNINSGVLVAPFVVATTAHNNGACLCKALLYGIKHYHCTALSPERACSGTMALSLHRSFPRKSMQWYNGFICCCVSDSRTSRARSRSPRASVCSPTHVTRASRPAGANGARARALRRARHENTSSSCLYKHSGVALSIQQRVRMAAGRTHRANAGVPPPHFGDEITVRAAQRATDATAIARRRRELSPDAARGDRVAATARQRQSRCAPARSRRACP